MSRLLAALIDYVLCLSVSLIISRPLASIIPPELQVDYEFILTLAFGLVYFGVGNSEVFGGQTFGKKLFGIFTAQNHGGNYLRISQSLLRYLFFIGIPLLLVSLPPILFRHFEVSASVFVLQLPSLLALLWFSTNVAMFFVDAEARALHDRLISSRVSSTQDTTLETPVPGLSYRSLPTSLILGFGLGGFLWVFALPSSPVIETLSRHQFIIEGRSHVRFANVDVSEEPAKLTLFYLPSTYPPDKVVAVIGGILEEKTSLSELKLELVSLEPMQEEPIEQIWKRRLDSPQQGSM